MEVTYLTWTEDNLLRQVSSAIFSEVGNRGAPARYALGTGVPLNKLEALMKRIAVAVVLAAMGVAAPSWAATDAECQELWKKADANSDGVLSDRESAPLRSADEGWQPHHGGRGPYHAVRVYGCLQGRRLFHA